MLSFTNNLDRTDEAAISNWPFTFESTLDFGAGTLTADSFLAVSVAVDETTTLPCRFKGVTSDGRLVICDAGGNEICSGQLYGQTHQTAGAPDEYASFFLYNQYNVLCGFATCKTDVAQQLFALAKYTNGMHYFSASAFVLLPQCHVQSMQGNVRSFGVNGKYTTANLDVRCTELVSGSTCGGHNVLPTGTTATGFSYGVFNVDGEPDRNGWCNIIVAGGTFSVADKNLIIKASCTSNLRVVDTDAVIILRGVQDA